MEVLELASKEFSEILKEMEAIHLKKNADYSFDTNPFSNFEITADLIRNFSRPIDQTFAGIIGIKLARLANLLSNGRTPNNESVDDTFKDLANYVVLWAAYYRYQRNTIREAENERNSS